MKRNICLLLCLLLMLSALPASAAGVSSVMCITNCNEWVSLRESPDINSKRLAKVPLGELVTDCTASYDDFVKCNYNGITGYILHKYLKTTDFSSGDGILGNQMVVDVMEYVYLRAEPNTSAKKLMKVPVGAIVTSCVSYYGNYVYCEYQGKKGYITASYLAKANYNTHQQDASVAKKYTGLYPAMGDTVEVVNVNEWASLRAKPSDSSTRLARVPLGTYVSGCIQVSDSFVYCCYLGIWGYMHTQYLSALKPNTAVEISVPDKPVYADLLQIGTTLVDFWDNLQTGNHIVVQKITSENTVLLYTAVYDSNYQYLSSMSMQTEENGELPTFDAFIGGPINGERVLLLFDGEQLSAYGIGPMIGDNMIWSAPLLTAGLVHEVDDDGNIFVTGYYDNKLTCISPDGAVKWQTENPAKNIYWPRAIITIGNQVQVIYEENGRYDDTEAEIVYNKTNGSVMTIKQIR